MELPVEFELNGEPVSVNVEPRLTLGDCIRHELRQTGTHIGCEHGVCGACTVIVDGVAIRSCIMPAAAVTGEITTLDGLAKNGTLHPLQQAWIDEQVPQCGYCQNGQIMTAKALLDRNPNPTDAEIRDGMEGVLCRCMTYYRIQAAIKRVVRATATAADERATEGAAG